MNFIRRLYYKVLFYKGFQIKWLPSGMVEKYKISAQHRLNTGTWDVNTTKATLFPSKNYREL